MKDVAKGIGAFLYILIAFLYNIFCVVIPIETVLHHFCPGLVTGICMILFIMARNFIPLVPDIILLILYIIGIPFAWSDFPIFFFAIYIIFMIIQYIITVPLITASIRAKRIINRKNRQTLKETIDQPQVDMEDFDIVNDDDDYDYYR